MPNTTTKNFVQIQDIKDNIVILKGGSLRAVIEVNSMNFELKSQDEQTAIIQRFQDFLNALDFPVQILILSRRLNIKNYLDEVNKIIEGQINELLRIQALEYSRFIKGLTELTNIMSKKFYIIVPFYITIIQKKGSLSLFKRKEQKDVKDQDFANYKTQLEQRVNLILDNIANIGLSGIRLDKEALANLYYQLYNPGSEMILTYQ